jgi:ATP-dependent DNA helicase RecG
MKSAAELFDELNQLDEHHTVESKTAAEVGRSLLETVCAFANEPNLGGGYVLLGVAAAKDSLWPSYEVLGIDYPDQLQSDIASQCTSVYNVPIRPRMVPEKLHGKTVISIFVPEAGTHEKPVHFKNQPLPGSAFRRIGSTDQHCTEDDLVLFYQDRRGETYDEQIVADAELVDLDPEIINQYRQLRRDVDADAEELRWSNEDLLEALGAIRKQEGAFRPTVAGILLFGTGKALRKFFPMMRIDYIRVPGIQWVKDPDRRFDTVEIRSPLIRSVLRARAAILDDLPRAFSLPADEIQGREIPLLPDRVIREVVANAVMHRSYRVHGSIQIIRYANRLEIRNPGYSLKAEERLGEPGSETRNPKIAAVFHDVKFAETKGSGIRVMRELMGERNLSPPVLQSDRTDNSFLAILLFHHFLSQEDLDWLATFKEYNLTEDEMKALVSAREVGAIDNSSYRDVNRGVDTLTASKHLRRLCDFKMLKKKGQGSNTYYVPTDKILASWNQIQLQHSSGKPRESTGKPRESTGKPRESTGKPRESIGKPRESIGKPGERMEEQSDRTDLLARMPDNLRNETQRVSRREKNATLRSLIHKLCSWEDLSLASLARLLNRNETYLGVQIISPMVKDGELQFTIPKEPNHPKQTYRAVVKTSPANPSSSSSGGEA